MSTVLSPLTRPPTTTSRAIRSTSPRPPETGGAAARVRSVPTRILQRELERRRALQEMRRRRVVEQARREQEEAHLRALMLGALVAR